RKARSKPAGLLLLLNRGLLLVLSLLVVDASILVLLIFRDEIVHVGLSLSELHLVHTLASVPVQEGLATEHGGELLANALEQLLNSRRVADKGRRHLETARRDRA